MSRRHLSTVTAVQPFAKWFTSFCPNLASAVNFALSRRKNYVCPFSTSVASCINEQGLIFLLHRRGNPAIFFYYMGALISAPAEGLEGSDSASYCQVFRITWPLSISQLSIHFLLPSAVRLWMSRVLIAIRGLSGNCAAYSGNALPTVREDLSVPYKDSWPLKMGSIYCAETSVRNNHHALTNFPELRRSHPHRGGSPISPLVWLSRVYYLSVSTFLNEWRWLKKFFLGGSAVNMEVPQRQTSCFCRGVGW